jgi:hypothetical protein
MDELNQFEARFAERLRAYSAAAARRPDPAMVGRALESMRAAETRRSWWMRIGRGPRMFVLVGAALLGVGGGAFIVGSRPTVLPPTPEPTVLIWSPERALQDWPGAPRVEPAGGPLIVAGLPTSGVPDYAAHTYIDAPRDVVPEVAFVDIVEVQFGEDCWFPPSGCVFFKLAGTVPQPRPDPRVEWIAYGLIVDTTGDGRPEFRLGMDNAPGPEHRRQWRTDLLTGTVTAEIDVAEHPGFMDSVFPDEAAGRASIYANRRPDKPVFRFYVWASVIRDGELVATDYAPDIGWLEMRP